MASILLIKKCEIVTNWELVSQQHKQLASGTSCSEVNAQVSWFKWIYLESEWGWILCNCLVKFDILKEGYLPKGKA